MLNTSSVSKRVKEQQAKQASSSAIIMVKSFSIVRGSCLLAKHFELKKEIFDNYVRFRFSRCRFTIFFEIIAPLLPETEIEMCNEKFSVKTPYDTY